MSVLVRGPGRCRFQEGGQVIAKADHAIAIISLLASRPVSVSFSGRASFSGNGGACLPTRALSARWNRILDHGLGHNRCRACHLGLGANPTARTAPGGASLCHRCFSLGFGARGWRSIRIGNEGI